MAKESNVNRKLALPLLLLAALSGCDAPTAGEENVSLLRLAVDAPLDFHLTSSNVSEFDEKSDIVARVEADGANTRVTIVSDPSWPVTNAFLGFDKFFYNADFAAHPIIRVISDGCDEPVVDKHACGWNVNTGLCQADGFGCFASLASADPGGHGGQSSPLVFVLAGDAPILPNAQGARLSLHARFGEAPGNTVGCSGWFADGENLGPPQSDPGCVGTPNPSCTLSVSPVLLSLERGGTAQATINVSTFGTTSPVNFTINSATQPMPVGYSVSLVPNPLTPPGTATFTVQASSLAELGAHTFTIAAKTGDSAATCEANVSVNVVEKPLEGQCGCY